MDNHYILIIETLEDSLSRGMRHLNGVYTPEGQRGQPLMPFAPPKELLGIRVGSPC
jgi:hypothetical protein